MKQAYLLCVFLSAFSCFAQKPGPPRVCGNVSNEIDHSLFAKNKVRVAVERQVSKRTGEAQIETIREYSRAGCLSKTVYPDPDNFAGGKWSASEWTFTPEGFQTGYRQLWFDKDSAEVVYHDEWYVLENGRYTEKYYRYNDPRPNYQRAFDREDLFFRYDVKGYELLMLHVKMKGKDTTESESHYFMSGVAEPWRSTYRRYSPGGSWTLHVTDEKKRPLKTVMYNGGKEVKHTVYEYKTDASGRLVSERQYEVTDGRKKLKREIEYPSKNRTVTTNYDDGKKVDTHEDVRPLGDPVEVEREPSNPCIEKETATFSKSGEKVVTRWSECPGSKARTSVYVAIYSAGGLLLEQNSEEAEFKTTYEYKFY